MKKKSIVTFFAWGLGMVLSAVPVMAASAPFLQGYHTEEGQLQFYMASQGNTVAADQLTVTLSGEEVPVSLIETTSQIPVTYYCLTDVSGSMREEQFAQVKDVLQAVCDGMTEGDNLVLATLGNQVETTGFLDDTEEITEAIGGLSVGNEDTNLYYGIVEAIRLLEENPEVCERKCLVILSDGKDDQKTGITKSEADAAVESSRIPVYTVATLRSEQTEEQLADAKLLGSFANESAGGAHYTPMLTDGENGASVGKAITGGMKQSLRVTTDTSDYQASKDILLLRVIYQNGGSVRLEDTMEVFAQELKYAETEPETEPPTEPATGPSTEPITEPETEPETEPATEPATEPETEPATEPATEPETEPATEPETEPAIEPVAEPAAKPIPVIIGAAAAILILVLVFVLGKKRKKTEETPNNDNKQDPDHKKKEDSENRNSKIENPQKEDPEPDISKIKASEGQGLAAQVRPVPSNPQGEFYNVRFTAIGYEKICFTLRMEENTVITVGRTDRAQLVLNGEDTSLSAVHCKMRCQKDRIEVWDAGSKNGTFLNGVRLKRGASGYLENQGRIRMGSYEYRISIMK